MSRTHGDECALAALDLDDRRQEHEKRHKRFRLQSRPATRIEMIRYIQSIGATPAAESEELRHVPVTPVADGIAFAPWRMTLDMLTDTYEHLHQVARPEGRVYDRIERLLDVYPGGLREQDLVGMTGVSRTAVRKALARLAFDGKLTVKEEDTRPGGTPRKRYFPAPKPKDVRLDAWATPTLSMYDVIPDPNAVDPAEGDE